MGSEMCIRDRVCHNVNFDYGKHSTINGEGKQVDQPWRQIVEKQNSINAKINEFIKKGYLSPSPSLERSSPLGMMTHRFLRKDPISLRELAKAKASTLLNSQLEMMPIPQELFDEIMAEYKGVRRSD